MVSFRCNTEFVLDITSVKYQNLYILQCTKVGNYQLSRFVKCLFGIIENSLSVVEQSPFIKLMKIPLGISEITYGPYNHSMQLMFIIHDSVNLLFLFLCHLGSIHSKFIRFCGSNHKSLSRERTAHRFAIKRDWRLHTVICLVWHNVGNQHRTNNEPQNRIKWP